VYGEAELTNLDDLVHSSVHACSCCSRTGEYPYHVVGQWPLETVVLLFLKHFYEEQ
jgi:hypothetical protein